VLPESIPVKKEPSLAVEPLAVEHITQEPLQESPQEAVTYDTPAAPQKKEPLF